MFMHHVTRINSLIHRALYHFICITVQALRWGAMIYVFLGGGGNNALSLSLLTFSLSPTLFLSLWHSLYLSSFLLFISHLPSLFLFLLSPSLSLPLCYLSLTPFLLFNIFLSIPLFLSFFFYLHFSFTFFLSRFLCLILSLILDSPPLSHQLPISFTFLLLCPLSLLSVPFVLCLSFFLFVSYFLPSNLSMSTMQFLSTEINYSQYPTQTYPIRTEPINKVESIKGLTHSPDTNPFIFPHTNQASLTASLRCVFTERLRDTVLMLFDSAAALQGAVVFHKPLWLLLCGLSYC